VAVELVGKTYVENKDYSRDSTCLECDM
jgi:hypothetical protein